ncbi:MAG: hypothetical protein RIQ33_228 [Bacteroidota bacterium]|jgi:hypothetical protein
MKILFSCVSFFCFFLNSNAQSIIGKYVGNDGCIDITNDSALTYRIKIKGCLNFTEAAYTNYKIVKDSLIFIYPIQNNSFIDSMKKDDSFIHVNSYNTFYFKFLNKEHNAIKGKYYFQSKIPWRKKIKSKIKFYLFKLGLIKHLNNSIHSHHEESVFIKNENH